MMHFSVEQILSVRNNYRDPPYPGFCLEEVVRRRRTGQTKLVRGENAWVAKGVAESEKEWVQRLVQSNLNKITEKNKDIMLKELCVEKLFQKSEISDMVVEMIFKKALDEPENAKLYAGVCLSLALYEANEVNKIQEGQRPQSNLRDAVIHAAQDQFRAAKEELPITADMCEEEIEMLRLNAMRRQRSNMTFVGELYLCTVLSHVTMFDILNITINRRKGQGFPPNNDIELLVALLSTVGERLDSTHKSKLDAYFTALAGFIKNSSCPYPHRIRFKIMDILDLRKSGWGTRAKAVKPVTAASPSHSKEKRNAPAAASSPSSSAAAARKGGRGAADVSPAGGKSWREGPGSGKAAGSLRAASPTAAGAGAGLGLNGRGTASATTATSSSSPAAAASAGGGASAAAHGGGGGHDAAFRGTPAPEVPLVKFELRVASMLQEWVADRTNDMILHWVEQFNACDRAFESESELCVAVATEVITAACLTTRKDAQREAFSFLVVGLFMVDTEVFDGFASALATAIEDGILEDVPKFGERYMHMLRLTSTEQETRADVYFDAANVLRLTYNRLEEPDDFAIDTLMGFWDHVPHLGTDEETMIRMDLDVIYNICNPEGAQPGLEKLLSRVIHSMFDLELMEPEVLDDFLNLEVEDGLCATVIADFKQRYF